MSDINQNHPIRQKNIKAPHAVWIDDTPKRMTKEEIRAKLSILKAKYGGLKPK